MRRFACILLLACFFISTICVPEADFSLLSQLPALYWHCKTTEDADMNFIDFITDHLINIDGLFDKHLPGDEQKPHQPFQFHNIQHSNDFIATFILLNVEEPVFRFDDPRLTKTKSYHSSYIAYIFHPPDAL